MKQWQLISKLVKQAHIPTIYVHDRRNYNKIPGEKISHLKRKVSAGKAKRLRNNKWLRRFEYIHNCVTWVANVYENIEKKFFLRDIIHQAEPEKIHEWLSRKSKKKKFLFTWGRNQIVNEMELKVKT